MSLFIITDGEFIMDDRSRKIVGEQIELADDIAAQYSSRLQRVVEVAKVVVVPDMQRVSESEVMDPVKS